MIDTAPNGTDVAKFLGRQTDTALSLLANEHVALVTMFVRGYVGNNGFDPTDESPTADVEPALRAVIITATARLVTNPAQTEREGADGWYAVGAFRGFSLPELAVLHRFRRRTA